MPHRISVLLACMLLAATARAASAQELLPNILWITSEDNGPQLGAYGDRYATTPNLDRLAARGMRFRHAWSNAPVCAPARTAIISGMYPTTTGSEHMRSMVRLPASMRLFPAYLRERGYYTANNVKEDYNIEKTADVWDDSSAKAHWRNRRPGQPFFAVFNITVTHESRIRERPHVFVHDPSKAPVPPYHPDTPEVRQDWAQYYDRMTEMDRRAGELLAELEADGLAERTIVFYFGDHGPGLPRLKRWPYDGGLRVPLIVYVPEAFRALAPDYAPGRESTRLVSFVDLAPTMLSLAGVAPPRWMQGRAFLGRYAVPGPEYLYGFRGRMDERVDLVRSVRDARYVYIRHFMPHRPYGQHIAYMFETPTTRVWKRLHEEGRLAPPRTAFWEPKPHEELYDLEEDPHEVRNLAGSPAHREVRDRLRRALWAHLIETRDIGLLPEGEMRRRAGDSTPYEMGQDPARYDVEAVLRAAADASDPDVTVGTLAARLPAADPAVRFWAATGLLIRGRDAVSASRDALRRLLDDPLPEPRIAAAEALGRFGDDEERAAAVRVLLDAADVTRVGHYTSILALNALNHLGNATAETKAVVRALPQKAPAIPRREAEYVPRLVEAILGDLR
ncbi:MAG TPA: sulfatase-like hydrolase/transferase [Vicinamibacterales bacterium]